MTMENTGVTDEVQEVSREHKGPAVRWTRTQTLRKPHASCRKLEVAHSGENVLEHRTGECDTSSCTFLQESITKMGIWFAQEGIPC